MHDVTRTTLLWFVILRGITRRFYKTALVKKLYTVRGVSVVGQDSCHTAPWPTTPIQGTGAFPQVSRKERRG